MPARPIDFRNTALRIPLRYPPGRLVVLTRNDLKGLSRLYRMCTSFVMTVKSQVCAQACSSIKGTPRCWILGSGIETWRFRLTRCLLSITSIKTGNPELSLAITADCVCCMSDDGQSRGLIYRVFMGNRTPGPSL